jgi:hypothetical protein
MRSTPRRARVLAAMTACALAALGACSTRPAPAEFVVLPGEYPAAFEAARAAMSDARFMPDRVDARAGLLESRPKSTSGLATPWDAEQSTLGQEWDDFANQHRRVVRISFAPADADAPQAADAAAPDRLTDPRPLVGRVEVDILRVRRDGRRVETEAISRSSVAQDPAMARRGLGGAFLEPVGRDAALAGRLAANIRRALGKDEAPAADVAAVP